MEPTACLCQPPKSGHFRTAMYFTKMLAERNMIGFLATNASPAMAPSAAESSLWQQSAELAAPTGLSAPFILDISHTEVAREDISRKGKGGHTQNWALDQGGRPRPIPRRPFSDASSHGWPQGLRSVSHDGRAVGNMSRRSERTSTAPMCRTGQAASVISCMRSILRGSASLMTLRRRSP